MRLRCQSHEDSQPCQKSASRNGWLLGRRAMNGLSNSSELRCLPNYPRLLRPAASTLATLKKRQKRGAKIAAF